MKIFQKFKDFNIHLRLFILISLPFFASILFANINLLIEGDAVVIGGIAVPAYVGYLGVFGSFWMIVMAVYYYMALSIDNHE